MRKTDSTNFQNETKVLETCPIYRGTRLIAGRWRTHILWLLNERPMRFSELCHLIPLATERIIALRLGDLQRDGLIESYEDEECKAYRLTELGDNVLPVLEQLVAIGMKSRGDALEDVNVAEEATAG